MRRCLPILVVLILALPFSIITSGYASVTNPYAPLSTLVKHSMTVRVGIIGISDIDLNQLLWNLEPEIRPSIQTNHSPQGFSTLNWGTSFAIKYDINSVPTAAASNLKNYLKSIAKTETVPDYLQGSTPDSNRYTTLDALKTEDWLNTHISDFGGIPDDGYLLIVADLSDISNLSHYYSISYNDLDKASSQATNAGDPTLFPVVDWMFSWGGHHRFYFIDLSGGDPDFDYTQTGHVPIQDFDVRGISNQQVRFSRNGQTVTEYVADYVAEATRNLFLPDYAYAPTYATSYRIVVNLFDETGKISDTNVGNYLSTSMVKQAYQAFIPYASWDVTVTMHQLRDDAGLAKAVSDSLAFTRTARGGGASSSINYYDYRQVYFYLQSHMGQYVDAKGDTIVLPIFEFVFKNGARFEQSTEESIGSSSVGSFAGISLGDLAMVGSNDLNLFDNGVELTHDTIHEVGHSMGCMHPHSFGQTEDYVSSVMSYSTYEYAFSQFDTDAVQRAHVDRLLLQTQDTARQQAALASYTKKDYVQAIKILQGVSQGVTASTTQTQTLTMQTQTQAPPSEWLLAVGFGVGIAVGIIVGGALAVVLIRRRKTPPLPSFPAPPPIPEPPPNQPV